MLQLSVKIFLLISLLASATVGAQTAADKLVIEHYNTQNGLTHAHVYQVFQDSRGFIWLVTGNALLLYDGFIFMPVMEWDVIKSPGDIRLLFEDRAGKIWLQKNHNSYYLIDIRSFAVTGLEIE
ncbi:MAG: two-component regulator propeller domain-containing protein, partial [Bacteroidota bacterium]